MFLAVDAGNSNTVFGLHDHQQWRHVWRTRTLLEEPMAFHITDRPVGDIAAFPAEQDRYEKLLRLWFLESAIPLSAVESVVISSVVPEVTHTLRSTLMRLFNVEPVVIGPAVYPALPMQILRPYAIGTDLVANALAAYLRYKQNCVIVDFGTALTFTTVTGDGKIAGVAIAPGLKTAVRSLFSNTAQLPEVPLVLPESALGTSTAHAIQAGVVMGYEGLVRSLIHRIRTELNGDCIAIATGGMVSVIPSLQADFVEIIPNLTLDGIREIGLRV
ncbi:type III pantothenate kinase [Larkinella arboricola]|uniref:Type III pantothenate kinase n=1 Tax=Larkinella arboricola TaxID=643671 RepID=A0A327X5Y3_LARAB|nr:type III pantothenate kinase [Larkinella arboricola]RAK02079.1 type III pantothenate kinase [Larkinella arboricola]